jgi:enterochelin esterase-like enzyme
MLRSALTVAVIMVFSSSGNGQEARVFDDLSMTSEILSGERRYAIYLPPDYHTASRSYPVLYLLQGRHDDHTSWIQFGEVDRIADKAIRDGEASPMIIVTANAMDGTDNYFNRVDRDWQYEDFFFEEFIPYIERTYRVRTDKRYRAIAGQSMGGGGAFVYALHRPEMFSSSAPLSASFELTPESFRRYFDVDPSISDETFQAHWERHSVIHLIENTPNDQKDAVRWYVDCGDDDYLYERNSLAHIAMRKAGIPHEYRVRDGGHEWHYWREALPVVLAFVSESFRR